MSRELKKIIERAKKYKPVEIKCCVWKVGNYFVSYTDGVFNCTCNYHVRRGRVCKHIVSVILGFMEDNNGEDE